MNTRTMLRRWRNNEQPIFLLIDGVYTSVMFTEDNRLWTGKESFPVANTSAYRICGVSLFITN